jgi:hypothetical protein
MCRRVVAWVLATIALGGVASSSAEACDAGRRSVASGPHVGRAPLILGDSTMIFAAPYLGGRGFEADAHGCRQFSAGVAMLAGRRRSGTLPRYSVLALGANGPVSESAVEGALHAVGPRRVLGIVTPRNRADSSASMRAAARRHPTRVLLLDWTAFSQGHGGWFGGDGLHVNDTGARAFAAFIARHSSPEMPPVRLLHVPRSSQGTIACGTIRRLGRRLRVQIVRGAKRIRCARARHIARTPPLRHITGWRPYDWRGVRRGPWAEVYARLDRQVLVGTISRGR